MVPPRIVAGGVLTHAPAKVAVLVASGEGRKLSLRTMESLKGKKRLDENIHLQNEKRWNLILFAIRVATRDGLQGERLLMRRLVIQ